MVFATVKFEIDVWYIEYYQNCKLIPLLFIILKKCVLFGKFGQVDTQTADSSIFKPFYFKNKDNYNE
jgi:hypothetical protein